MGSAGQVTAAVMAKDEGAVGRKRKPGATESADGPAAKRRAKEEQRAKPRRGSGGADARETDKKKEGKKSTEARICSVCPNKPARDHLRPGEHCEGTEYWCEECWEKLEGDKRGRWKSNAAASHQTPVVKVVRSPEQWAAEKNPDAQV